MITEMEMYWLTRMTGLHNGLIGIALLIMITVAIVEGICALGWAGEGTEKNRKFIRFSKYMVPTFIVGLLLAFSSIFIPTTKEMCAIKAVPVIVNNEHVQELPNKVVELANEWIDELKPSKESE